MSRSPGRAVGLGGTCEQAEVAVLAVMYPDGDGPRHVRSETQVVVGTRHAG